MLDIRCVYDKTIALHTPDHQYLVIGDEIGRAQQYADPQDLIMRYDSSVSTYGSLSTTDAGSHLTITREDITIIYDQSLSSLDDLPDAIHTLLIDISGGYDHFLTLGEHHHVDQIIIMPCVGQELAIRCASDLMRTGLPVPKFLKEGQYVSIEY